MTKIKLARTFEDLPIACALSDPNEIEGRRRAIKEIFAGIRDRKELSDGYEFIFPGDDEWAARLMQFVSMERKCCPFLQFELAFEQGCGPIHVTLRGGAGVKEFIAEWVEDRN